MLGGVVSEILPIAVKCTVRLASCVKEALVLLPSALSGVSEMLPDVGPRPQGRPRGEDQMPRWLLPILCANAVQRRRRRVNVGGTGEASAPLIRRFPLLRCPDVLER